MTTRSKTTWWMGLGLGVMLAIASVAGSSRHAAAEDKRGLGADCHFDSDCESGSCSSEKCKSATGHDKLEVGSACHYDSECKSGNCSSEKCKGDR